jgi:hypothetical protein
MGSLDVQTASMLLDFHATAPDNNYSGNPGKNIHFISISLQSRNVEMQGTILGGFLSCIVPPLMKGAIERPGYLFMLLYGLERISSILILIVGIIENFPW